MSDIAAAVIFSVGGAVIIGITSQSTTQALNFDYVIHILESFVVICGAYTHDFIPGNLSELVGDC